MSESLKLRDEIFKTVTAAAIFLSLARIPDTTAQQSKKCFSSQAIPDVVFNTDQPLNEMNLRGLDLVIAEEIFRKSKNGGGFKQRNDSKSWKHWYHESPWSSAINGGIYEIGGKEAKNFFIWHRNGISFKDGSFSVGIRTDDVENPHDKWAKGKDWGSCSLGDCKYQGQMFFDKMGRPVAVAITSKSWGQVGSGYSWVYKNGKWEYESNDDWDERHFSGKAESLDPTAPRFLRN